MACSRIFWLMFLLPAAPGCVFAHRPPLVPVQVVDAETKAPIAGARVRLWCPDPHAASPGKDSDGLTGPDGVAHVRGRAKDELGIVVEASATGYFSEETDFRWNQMEGGVFAGNTIELFAGPRPTIDFVLPTGFRGLLKAEIRIQDDFKPGQRQFTGIVGTDGKVQIAGSPVLKHGLGPVYSARFGDDKPLSLEPKELEVGLRFLKDEGDTHYFVVGTQEEWNSIRRSMNTDPPGSRNPGGRGNGGGGGGRGGRGGGGGGRGGGGGMGGGGGRGGGGMGAY